MPKSGKHTEGLGKLYRKRRYDGKVKFDDVSHFETEGELDEVQIYTPIVNSAHFKRDLPIVYLVKQIGNKAALLFSTDLSLNAKTIVRYYKARFQIEFLFRDAKVSWSEPLPGALQLKPCTSILTLQ